MRHRLRAFVAGLAGSMFVVLVFASPSSADRVCTTTINGFGQSIVACTDVESTPGSSTAGAPAPVDNRYHWHRAGCHTFAGAYREGATVTFTVIGPPTDDPDLYVDARHSTPVDWTTYHGTTPRTVPGAMRYSIACDTGNGGGVVARFTNLPPNPSATDPVTLRTTALANLTVPTTTLGANPPLGDPSRRGLANVPVWLWVDSPWTTVVAEQTEGSITVRVEATPVQTIWTMGDGSTLSCQQGTEWQPGLPDSAATCQHTYQQSSASQPLASFTIGATVQWEYSWSVNGVDQGTFGAFEALTSSTYEVGEIQTVNR